MAAAIAVAMLATSCNYAEEDDVLVSRRSTEALERQRNEKDYTVWEFVHSTSAVYYLWNDNVPMSEIDYSKYATPEDLFESFRHEDDRFSAVLSNYSETLTQLSDNSYETDGLNYQLYLDGSTGNNVVAIVDYVYDDSPAKEAGIKRGYAIHKINGTQLTTDNYAELLAQKTCTYSYSVISMDSEQNLSYGDNIQESSSVTKTDMVIDPILKTSVIVRDNKRIGYFLYDSFTFDTDGIIDAIEKLEAQQIDELVLDLRLNPGGYISTLDTLASMLVPDGHAGDVFITENYNSTITSELRRETGDKDFNKTFFSDNLPNLHLSRLYVLTSNSTASASEELISGLMPYMPVTIIGDQTYGKFTSNLLINDDIDEGSDDNDIPYSEWAVYICVASCTNSLGEMNFKEGFTPDYEITDTYQYELGDEQEPLLAKALELCTGALAKSTHPSPTPMQGYIAHYGKPSAFYGLISTKN